jgi:hypothetical protein
MRQSLAQLSGAHIGQSLAPPLRQDEHAGYGRGLKLSGKALVAHLHGLAR